MKNKKLLLMAAFSTLLVSAVQAQKEKKELLSYSFVELQGGLQLTSTDAKMTKLFTPTASVSFGHYFTPVVGARLHVNGWQAKSGFDDLDQYYKWKYITPDLDLMLNLTNLFSKNKSGSHPLNVILLGGVGLNIAWDNTELKGMGVAPTRIPLAWDKNLLSHNLRAGLRLETNVTKPFGVSLELNANSLNDRFNSKTNDADDWQFSLMLGVAYRFCHKYKEPKFVKRMVDVIDTIFVDEPTTIMVKEKRPIVKMEKTSMEKTVFFKIAQSNSTKATGIDEAIKEAADLMKTSSDATFVITGYADKGTGTAKINKRYAQKRADDVANKLIKEHGIDASRIKTDSKGDTVQPFPENSKNRCVIITGEGTFKVESFEEVEVEKQTTKKVKKAVVRQVEVEEEVK
jgi:outer membrane protein OmpA-like peptidoglycan-associated protein